MSQSMRDEFYKPFIIEVDGFSGIKDSHPSSDPPMTVIELGSRSKVAVPRTKDLDSSNNLPLV